MQTTLTAMLRTARVAELHEPALRERHGAAARKLRRRVHKGAHREARAAGAVTIRWAIPGEDDASLTHLAALDSSPALSGPLLVAEVDGQLRAALQPHTRRRIADPFFPTADVLLLLRMRARQLPEHGRAGASVSPARSESVVARRAC